MEEWKEYKIKDICKGIYEGPHATPKKSQTGGIYLGIPAISIDGHINFRNAKRIAEEDLPLWTKRVTPQEDDIVFTNEATLNLYALIPAGFHGCLGRRLGLVRPNKELVNAKFLFYYFFSPEWRNVISQNKVYGATVERILMTKFPSFPIKLPSLPIQNKIVNILSSFDDKIEVNRRINENLEQQAQALFKSWFVDFEPFKDGEFVECELGRIPKGWRVYSLSEFLPVITGKKDANVAKGGPYPFFSCSQDFGWTDDYSFEGNAILVAGNGDFNVKMYNGKFEAYQRTYVLIPHNPQYTAWLFYAVKYHLNDITSAARGSVIKFITKGNLADFRFPAPSNLDKTEVIERFSCIKRIVASNQQESRRLATLRDTLLPKLMSGELKVNEVAI